MNVCTKWDSVGLSENVMIIYTLLYSRKKLIMNTEQINNLERALQWGLCKCSRSHISWAIVTRLAQNAHSYLDRIRLWISSHQLDKSYGLVWKFPWSILLRSYFFILCIHLFLNLEEYVWLWKIDQFWIGVISHQHYQELTYCIVYTLWKRHLWDNFDRTFWLNMNRIMRNIALPSSDFCPCLNQRDAFLSIYLDSSRKKLEVFKI